MANAPTADRALLPQAEPAVRRIGTAEIRAALARGWEDFRANPTQLVFLALIYPLVGIVAATAAAGRDLMPLVWPLASGFALVGPVAALGVYELSRRRERGLPTSWLNAFDVLRSPALPSILALGLMLVAIFAAWIVAAQAIYRATFGGYVPATIGEFAWRLFNTAEGWQLILIGNGVGFLFAVAVLMLTVVSFPMLLDRPELGAGAAVRTSVRAVLANPGPMALWGLVVALLLALGSLPFFVGLAVAVPVLGHATWHLYRAVVAE
ncbi:DUF2189 domain-containing protein [Crenalkalicoccus roseus]|uniref:DUF2189 domain-containing protein n=1 Tax=Crenalkalicoccus roseus TaxID=1485588 RepID=UPI00107FEA41|nr:DUF2189 domain-containing protein [Crenalkalicoccus roseus]